MEEKFKKVLTNSFSLILLQSGNYVVPLVLTPYLIIKLGIESFGLLSFVMAVNTFFRVLTSYGFDLTATKSVSEYSHSRDKLSDIFVNVISSKFILCAISALILFFLVTFVPKIHENRLLLSSCFLLVIADVLFPVWLYQGVQNMKLITILKLSSRFIFVFLAIMFIESEEDILLVPLLEGGVALVISLISSFIAIKIFKIKIFLPKFTNVYKVLHSSFHVFLSKSSVLFYTSFNTVLLGFMYSPSIVGYYSVSEKVYMAAREIFKPLIQAVFPFLAKERRENYTKYCKYVKYTFYSFLVVLFIFSCLLYNLGPTLLAFLLDAVNDESLIILNIFSITLLFAVGGFLSSVLVLEEKGKVLSVVTVATVILNLILVYPLVLYFGPVGLAVCFLLVQIFHFVMQIYANHNLLMRYRNDN